ncbi:hypothetical protein D8B26_004461 [Coccidioides posadasii str. Silveira]|uniref:Predicted protein n=1 Tax=Coccidioides posadasii (strain RMSCC 757 / Silveira) TaxID=443226 RepID=E9DEZ7_COCPS|nr:predicted protein [Coccidioides posadasii str. Silveira]QVM09801.1 hypothetical protein D8B26_004461 [Coccidioides posadasii str. Silveira]
MKVVYGKKWIGDQFDGHGFEFPDGSTWEIKEKISEEALLFPDRHKEDLRSGGPSEAQAVYHCRQTKGRTREKTLL